MQINTLAGTKLIPTLSRIVLAIAFFFSGCYFLQKVDFSATDMARIQSMGDADAGDTGSTDSGTTAEAGEERALYTLALRLSDWKLGSLSVPIAFAVTFFQLLASGLILVGFFTRIATLGICVLLVGAFYQVTLVQNHMFDMNPFDWRVTNGKWYVMISQLSLFVLAAGLVLTGPGPLSVDRILWQRRKGGSGAKPSGGD